MIATINKLFFKDSNFRIFIHFYFIFYVKNFLLNDQKFWLINIKIYQYYSPFHNYKFLINAIIHYWINIAHMEMYIV